MTDQAIDRDAFQAQWRANDAELNRIVNAPSLDRIMLAKREEALLDEQDHIEFELGRIYLDDRFINMEMVRDGFAWRYVQYDKPGEFTAAEAEAREHRRGLWTDPNPTPPWEWRKAKRKLSTAH